MNTFIVSRRAKHADTNQTQCSSQVSCPTKLTVALADDVHLLLLIDLHSGTQDLNRTRPLLPVGRTRHTKPKKDQRTPRTRYQSTNAGGLRRCVQAANMDPVEQISLTSCALESVSSLGCLAMDPREKDLRRWLPEPLDRSRPWHATRCSALHRRAVLLMQITQRGLGFVKERMRSLRERVRKASEFGGNKEGESERERERWGLPLRRRRGVIR